MFDLTIYSTEGKEYQCQAKRVSLPTTDGTRTILTNHAEIVATVEIGRVLIRYNDQESEELAISEGIFHFKENQGMLIVRTFEREAEIDVLRAERARDEAKASMSQAETPNEMAELEMSLKRALVRLSTYKN